ncbi:MAG TPA: NAD-dependent epimerase/dehydratase family protein [Vicinamibacterales bacterium]|nr:NAD-dependent epimerase/dehydratase family protein [Vicinamibacterales bacterium]
MAITVLVTGARGLLGQHLMRALLESGRSVRALVRSGGDRDFLPDGVAMAVGDITNLAEVRRAMAGCDAVIHACSTHDYKLPPRRFWEVNVGGTHNVCTAAAERPSVKVVFTSTISTLASGGTVDGFPLAVPARKLMSLSKKAAEEEVLAHARRGLPAIVVNPPYFIGPLDYRPSPFRLWAPLAVRMPIRLVPGGGFNVMSARDVARAHVWALERGRAATRYPLVGRNVSLVEYASLLNAAAGRRVVPREIPAALLRSVAVGKVFDPYAVDLITRLNYVFEQDAVPIERESLEDLVSGTVRWFRDERHLAGVRVLAAYAWRRCF